MPFAGSFNVQGSFGTISADNFESGNAPDTQALFANGTGGTEWREPAGGGGSRTRVAYLGNPGTGEYTPTSAEVSAAWLAETGTAPQAGDMAILWDQYGNIAVGFFLAIYSLLSEFPVWSAYTITSVTDL